MKVTEKIEKYLSEGTMRLRLMNHNSALHKAQDAIKDVQHDIVTISVRGDAPGKLDNKGMNELNKLVATLDEIDIKIAYVRGMLNQLKDGVD